MSGQQVVVTIMVALVSGGIWPFLQAVLKRRPEVRQLDAQTTSITVQGAEATVTILMKSLQRAADREALLEERLATRERRIEELEAKLDSMQETVNTLQGELTAARQQLAQLHDRP